MPSRSSLLQHLNRTREWPRSCVRGPCNIRAGKEELAHRGSLLCSHSRNLKDFSFLTSFQADFLPREFVNATPAEGSAESPTAVGLFPKGNAPPTSDAMAWGPWRGEAGVRALSSPVLCAGRPLEREGVRGRKGPEEREVLLGSLRGSSRVWRGECSKGKWE